MRTIAIIIVAIATTTAYAEPTVLAIDGKDIYVDLGAKDGVGSGSELELLHEIVAKDPRTGQTLRDRFALGTIIVAKAGDALCVAHAEGELAKRVIAGDHVRLVSEKRAFVDPWGEQVAASKPVAPVEPGAPMIDHAELARRAWQDTLGQPPEQRVARWKQLVDGDPQSPYRKAIELEIASLHTQIAKRDAAIAKARSAVIDDRGPRIARLAAQLEPTSDTLVVGPIEHAMPGRAIELAFLVRAPAPLGPAWLYVRPHGDPGYHRIELTRDGDAYLRGAIDGAIVRAPYLEWYVEAGARPVVGSPEQPRVIEIDRDVREAPVAAGRSHVDLHVDYVDFDGKLSGGFDQYYQAEADFAYRFLEPVYAMRLGFGTLSGTGGPKDVINADPVHCLDIHGAYACKRVTFTYVYTELEYRFRPNVAVMIRPQIGELTTDTMPGAGATRCQGSDVSGCEFLTGFGARARLRLGEVDGTNLVLGAAFTRGVGTLFEAAYHWLPVPVVPVQLSVQVTDQPVVEEFGVRLIGDVGLRKLAWFYPSVRVSYQARDINHAGVSGGAALNFDW